MKYYLETNALRALGEKIDENQELQQQSYTSVFSIFELTKGIGKRPDSKKRELLISTLLNSQLNMIQHMPFEIMKRAFSYNDNVAEGSVVIEYLRNPTSNVDDYATLVKNYELDTLEFQTKSNQKHVRQKPEPEYIELDLETMFSRTEPEVPQGVKNLPEGVHPSRIAMECIKLELVPAIFRSLFADKDITDEEILEYYSGSLDLFLFAFHTYELKKHCLRESAAKSDFLDILHTAYLYEHDHIMVSNDKIFESILPNINRISVEEYKKLI